MKLFLYIIIVAAVMTSCGKESQADINASNRQEILDYLADNDIADAIETSSGLFITIDIEGSVEKPTLNSEITVTYRGTYTNGQIFDESTAPISFFLNNVIIGWQEGIPYFGRGGNGSLYIPSRLAYGQRGTGEEDGIPPNAVLVFDISVIDFE